MEKGIENFRKQIEYNGTAGTLLEEIFMDLLPLPTFPRLFDGSPEVVKVLDKIRIELDSEEFSEFNWFAREYPRGYRYYLDCANYRLESIYFSYKQFHDMFSNSDVDHNCFYRSISNEDVYKIYWDFESLLSSLNTALDILARIVGTAYNIQTPPSFNKLCKKELAGIVEILKAAQNKWVSRMKDYRDCFVHYTPVDTMLTMYINKYNNGWELRCKLPINPNTREILGFRYRRRTELLRYAISLYGI